MGDLVGGRVGDLVGGRVGDLVGLGVAPGGSGSARRVTITF